MFYYSLGNISHNCLKIQAEKYYKYYKNKKLFRPGGSVQAQTTDGTDNTDNCLSPGDRQWHLYP